MPVHIFGKMCDMDAIRDLADKYHLYIIEDAAEAHGALYKGKKAGSFSDIAAFSFFANKNITTGEGGMVITNNKDVYDRARYFKNVCFPLDGPRNYQHDDIGYNYRMSNVVAAIGLAQVEKADDYRAMRIHNHELYKKYLSDVPGIIFQSEPEKNCVDVCWMNTIVIDPAEYGHTKDELISHLKENGIDTRLLFTGMHKQKAMMDFGCDCSGNYPVCEWLTENGFYLPSSSGLSSIDIKTISDFIKEF
jgi:perosamine synthetase